MANNPTLTVKIAPTQALLLRIRRRAADLTPVFDGPIANRVYAMFGKIFATAGAYAGQAWAPLMPSTLASKARIHREHMGILRRYNTLWASLTKRGAPQGYRLATRNSLTIGTSVAYAAAHQEGGGRLPRRAIVPDDVPAGDVAEWEQLMVQHLEDA